MTRRIRSVLALAALLLPLACKDGGPTEPTPVVTSIRIAPTTASVPDGDTLRLTATLLDQRGRPLTASAAGATVKWSSADEAIVSVDDQGVVTAKRPGTAKVTAAAAEASASAEVTVTQVATTLALESGDAQQGTVGAALEEKLAVRATDRHGDPVPGVVVRWSAATGGGVVAAEADSTDAEGYARARWTLGAEAGEQRAEASAQGIAGSPVVFRATAAPANLPPVARDDSATTAQGTAVLVAVLANDSDADGDELTVEIVRAPSHGTAEVTADRAIRYTPAGDFLGRDSLAYAVADGRGGADTATVYLTVETGRYSEAQAVVGMRTLVHHEGRFYHVFHDDRSGDSDVYLRTSDDGVTWTPKVRVSDGPSGTAQGAASLAVWGSGAATRVAVSFADRRSPNPQLRVAVSTDGGRTFGPSVQLSSHGDSRDIAGSIAVGADGALYASWTRQYAGDSWDHVWFSRSTDGGASWSTPRQILNSGHYGVETHLVAGAAGEVWIAVATSPYLRKDIVVLRSTDGGGTWQSSKITGYTQSYWHADHPSMLRTPDGALYVIWQDTRGWREEPSRVSISRSDDGGATWTAPLQISDDVALGVAPNPHNVRTRPSLATDARGTLYAVWADDRQGATNHHDTKNYDVYLSTSTDGGRTWSTDVRVNDRPEVREQAYASVAAGPAGVLVVWRDLRLDPHARLHHRLIR